MRSGVGGTLLLDEIGYLPLSLQAELAAALHKRPVAANARDQTPERPRLISTTSRDLKTLMEAGAFRHDLYYQIDVLPIEVPPLGRRREKIPLLVSHFLEQAAEYGTDKKIYSRDTIELLATTDWPGNVRQLFEVVKQNLALSHGKVIRKQLVERSLGQKANKVPTYDEARETFFHTGRRP